MHKREKKILLLTVTAHALVHIFDGMVAPLLPLLVREFETNYFRIGVVVTMFSILFGAGALPAGILADRVGSRRLITIYLFGAGGAFIAVAMAGSYWGYAVIMAVAGLFCSTYHPASNTLIGQEIAARGNAFGIHGIAGSVGTAAAPVIVAWLGSRLGWRAPHLVFGVTAVLLALYSLRIPVRADYEAHERPVIRLATEIAPAASMVAFFIAAGLLGLAYRANMMFLPAFLGERVSLEGIDIVTAGGLLATVTLLSGAVGQYLGGRLVDRHSPEGLYIVALGGSIVFLVFMVLGGPIVLVGSAIAFALFSFMVQPIQNDMLARYIPEKRLGTAYGVHFLLVFGGGSFGGAGGGYLADRMGLAAVFVASILAFLVSAMLIFFMIWFRRRSRRPVA